MPSAPGLSSPSPSPATHGPRRRRAGKLGILVLSFIAILCVGTLPWTLRRAPDASAPRYNAGSTTAGLLPPSWCSVGRDRARQLNRLVPPETIDRIAAAHALS